MDVNCVKHETGKHLSGTMIAEKLNISRAAVSQILKRSIKKIYLSLKNSNKEYSTIQIISGMAKLFNIKTESEYKKFFRLLPENVKGEINAAAKDNGYKRN